MGAGPPTASDLEKCAALEGIALNAFITTCRVEGAAGLPTAVQLVSSHFQDATSFRATFELERALGPFVPA